MLKDPRLLIRQYKDIIRALQGDIPICRAPFREIARQLHISENALLDTIREMKAQGIIRRFGATLRHQRVGFRANAMSAWNVPEDRIEEVGHLFASFPQVTHCYERPPKGHWAYNLYAMIHGKSRVDCERIAQKIAERTGIHDYVLLFSSQENKKSSMQYF